MKVVFNAHAGLPIEQIYQAATEIIEEQQPKGYVSKSDNGVVYTTHSGKGKWTFEHYKLTFEGYRNSFIEGCDLCHVGTYGKYNQIALFVPALSAYANLDVELIETSTPENRVELFNEYTWKGSLK